MPDPAREAQGAGAVVGRAVAALDRIPWFTRSGLAALAMTNRTIAQVTKYLTDETVRQHAIDQVRQLITPTTTALIGHSLGSVVAYEALHELPASQQLPLFITLGSPLGLSPVNRRLLRTPPSFPPAVQRWVNLADRDDVVAARPDLLPLFGSTRPTTARFDSTYTVDNGAEPHRIGFYLTTPSCGRALGEAFQVSPLDQGR